MLQSNSASQKADTFKCKFLLCGKYTRVYFLRFLHWPLVGWMNYMWHPLLPITVFMYLQDPECFVLVCSFHISNPIYRSIFKSYHSLFVSVRQTYSLFPGDICFCQFHLHSLESNKPQSSPSFPWVFCLSVSLPSNDTFCRSRVFSISLPGFREIDLKGLEQVKKCGLNSNSGFNSNDHPGLNHSQRVPGAGTQALMKATRRQRARFTNKYLYSVKSI